MRLTNSPPSRRSLLGTRAFPWKCGRNRGWRFDGAEQYISHGAKVFAFEMAKAEKTTKATHSKTSLTPSARTNHCRRSESRRTHPGLSRWRSTTKDHSLNRGRIAEVTTWHFRRATSESIVRPRRSRLHPRASIEFVPAYLTESWWATLRRDRRSRFGNRYQ